MPLPANSKNNLSTFLDILEPYITDELISKEYAACMRKIFNELPLVSFGAFEIFFGENHHRVDLNISITKNEIETLLKWFAEKHLNKDAQSIYRAIQRFCILWSKENFYLKPFIDKLWLVYDIDDVNAKDIAPWYYVQYKSGILSFDNVIKSEIVLQTLYQIDVQLNERYREWVLAYIEHLPSECLVSGVGLHRNTDAIRLYLVFTQFDELLSFLKKNNWPGSVEKLENDLNDFAIQINRFGLLIDLNPDIQPQIGIECWFEQNDKKQIDKIMYLLTQRNLCTADQAKSFIKWNGTFEIINEAGKFYRPGNIEEDFASKNIIRRVSAYIKIVHSANKIVMAKGYAFFDRVLPKKI